MPVKKGLWENDSESIYDESLNASSRRSKFGFSPDRRSCLSSSSRSVRHSKRAAKGLKYYLKTLVDLEIFTNVIGDWVLDKTSDTSNKKQLFQSPFVIDDLRKLDYALEGVLFQQLFRMPHSRHLSDDTKENQYLALEDFLYTSVNGLWHTFWHRDGPLPFSISFPRYPGSKFYSIDKAILDGRLGTLSGAAVVLKSDTNLHIKWDQVLEFALFKPNIFRASAAGFSALTICEALFYGIHILLSRSLGKFNTSKCESIYLLVLDAKYGGVVKLAGDLGKLEIDPANPYTSIGDWIKFHATINISPVDRIWSKLGNVNWGDFGTLQLLLAVFQSIVECKGQPKNSIEKLAADHCFRLQKRRIECTGTVSSFPNSRNGHSEIIEIGYVCESSESTKVSCAMFKPGEVVLLEDSPYEKGFQIKNALPDGNCVAYSAISLDHPDRLLNLCVGSHSSRLEPSWEAMGSWYHVQRQTKVLNSMKQQGILSKHLPEIITSGRVLHSGYCRKQNPTDRCDHPLCGTPVLLTFPVGTNILNIIAREGPFSSEDAVRCCRDCLIAMKTVTVGNILHGDICPENIIKVHPNGADPESAYYSLVGWGHAVLEDRDSPAINLQFSSSHALQYRKLCPSSDVESLIYVLYFACGGAMQQQESIESSIQWREQLWAKRLIQLQLGEVSAILKAFADYVDTLCGTPYPVDLDIWLGRLNREVSNFGKGKFVERVESSLRLDDIAESSGTSGGVPSIF